MNVKINSKQYIGSNEWNRLKKSIFDDGFKKLFNNSISSYGVVNLPSDLSFENLKIIQGTASDKFTLKSGIAIDNNINQIVVANDVIDAIQVPVSPIWNYVYIKHKFSNEEVGEVDIASDGVITGNGTRFLEVLRQHNYHSTYIKFSNSSFNNSTYKVSDITSNVLAKIEGNTFVAENGLKYIVRGSFEPGVPIVPPIADIYEYDSYEIVLTSVDPTSTLIDGREFLLARVRYDGVNTEFEDLRESNIYALNLIESESVIDDSIPHSVVGLEASLFDSEFQSKGENLIYVGWGFSASQGAWAADPASNFIDITSGFGGTYKSVTDFISGDFDGYLAYFGNGQKEEILTSLLSGGSIRVNTRNLTNSPPSTVDLVIVPKADFIEFRTYTSSTNRYGVERQNFIFPIQTGYGIMPLNYTSSNVFVQYRLILGNEVGSWKNINDGDFYDELAFDSLGSLSTPTSLGSVSSGNFSMKKHPDNHQDKKAWIHKHNKFSAMNSEGFGADVQNDSSFVELITDGNSFVLDVTNPEVKEMTSIQVGTRVFLIPNSNVTFKHNSTTTTGKRINCSGSDFVCPAGQSIGLVETATEWLVFSLPVSLVAPTTQVPVGGIIMWDGLFTNFSTDGLGIGVLSGWALCNGNNGTRDLRGRFIVGAVVIPSAGAPILASEVDPTNGADNYAIGDKGGEQEVVLTINEIPSHNHIVNDPGHIHGINTDNNGTSGTYIDRGGSNANAVRNTNSATTGITINPTGGSKGHENRAPYYSLAYIKRIS